MVGYPKYISSIVCKTKTYFPLEPKTDTTAQLEKRFLQPTRSVGRFLQPTQSKCTWRNHRLPSPTRINLEEPVRVASTTRNTRFAWAGGTFFPVVLLCQFWFWGEIGFGCTYYILCTWSTIQLWCCVSFFGSGGK